MKTYKPRPKADFNLVGKPGDTLFLMEAVTPAAWRWIEDNVSDDGFQPLWPRSINVEHRHIQDLLAGIGDAGLVVAQAPAWRS